MTLANGHHSDHTMGQLPNNTFALNSASDSTNETSKRPMNQPDHPTAKRSKRQSAKLATLKNLLLYSNANTNVGFKDSSPLAQIQNNPFHIKSESPIPPSMILQKPLPPLINEQTDVRSLLFQRSNQEFVEPPLALPKPGFSGVPLELMPSAKVRRETLWPKLKKIPIVKKEGDTEIAEVDELIEKHYITHLETGKSAILTNDSKLRASPTPTSQTTTTIESKMSETDDILLDHTPAVKNSPMRSSKRIKVISPKKSITTTNLVPSFANIDQESNQLDESSNDDFCSACGGSGVFICCETCPKSFHFICCDPPLDDLPEDTWCCRECIVKQNPSLSKQWNSIGIFGQLLNQVQGMNPIEFQLPKKLRDNTFINVSTDDNGTYDDGSLKPELSYSKLNASQIPGFNYNHSLEIDTIYDKDGNPYLCHNCGLSGLNNKILVHCDYCPLVWHMDCLKSPCYKPKTIGTKWRCPNHLENLLPVNIFSKRNLKYCPVVDVSLHNHFLKVIQNSNFIIKYDDQPFIKNNGKFPTLQEYLQYELANFKVSNPEYDGDSMDGSKVNTLDNNDDIHDNFKVPEFFNNNFSIPGSMVSKTNANLRKIITMTDENVDDPFNMDDDNSRQNQVTPFVYRVPEKLILLDFITKVETSNNQTQTQHQYNKQAKQAILKNIEHYEQAGKQELVDQREFVENITQLKYPRFDSLVEAALHKNQATTDNTAVDQTGPNNAKVNANELSPEEIQSLLSIKKVMELKGKDKLLQFLES